MDEATSTGPCPRCGLPQIEDCKDGWVRISDGGAGTVRPCPQRDAKLGEQLIEAAAIPELYRGCTVDGFQFQGLQGEAQLAANREACRSYVRRFVLSGEQRTARGLLLIGPPGTGKTSLMVAVLKGLARLAHARVLFADFTDVCQRIQASFDQPEDSEAKVLRPLIEAQVLALDELGARRPTPFVSDTLYLIINTRYARKLPTLFSSNHPLVAVEGRAPRQLDRQTGQEAGTGAFEPLADRVGPRIFSRLFEATETPLLFDEAGDFRRRSAV